MLEKTNSAVTAGICYELCYWVSCGALQAWRMRTIGSLALPAKWHSVQFTKRPDTQGLICFLLQFFCLVNSVEKTSFQAASTEAQQCPGHCSNTASHNSDYLSCMTRPAKYHKIQVRRLNPYLLNPARYIEMLLTGKLLAFYILSPPLLKLVCLHTCQSHSIQYHRQLSSKKKSLCKRPITQLEQIIKLLLEPKDGCWVSERS